MKPNSNSTMSRIWDDVNKEGNVTIMSRIEAVLADLTTEYKEGSSPRRSPLPDILADHQVPSNSTMRASICPNMMPMSQVTKTKVLMAKLILMMTIFHVDIAGYLHHPRA